MFLTLLIVFLPAALLAFCYIWRYFYPRRQKEFFPLLEENWKQGFLKELKHWDGKLPPWIELSCHDDDDYY